MVCMGHFNGIGQKVFGERIDPRRSTATDSCNAPQSEEHSGGLYEGWCLLENHVNPGARYEVGESESIWASLGQFTSSMVLFFAGDFQISKWFASL